jgi:CHC2 zinc finger
MRLNAYQIAESFPEEAKELIPKILPILRARNIDVTEKVNSLMVINLTPEQKDLYRLFVQSFYNENDLVMIRTYEKVMELVNRDFSHDRGFRNAVEKAKNAPIWDFHQFLRSRVTETRINASCPFHGQDKHPSFVVYKDNNTFHCFTCKVSGDAIDFYMLINKCTFNQAVKGLT